MRILHIEAGKHFYGGARQVGYLITGLAQAGIENILLCPEENPLTKEVEKVAEVVPTVMKGDLDVGLYRRLYEIILQKKPDIVHLHSRRGADIWGALAAKKAGIPCVLSRRVDNPEAHWWARLKYSLYDHVITISEAIRKILIHEGVPSEKITCVRSSVDPAPYMHAVDRSRMRQEFGLPQNALIIGIVAQLISRKGHGYLLEACEALVKLHPQVHVLCFGQGPLLSALKRTVKQKGLERNIHFTGFRSDLPTWLGGLDILAHPADMEGLGVSLLQASAAAVPIVTTQAGGLPEAVEDGVSGILIKPGDVPELTSALNKLIETPELRSQLGKNGRDRILKEFSVSKMVRGNLDIYEKIIKTTR